MKTSRNLPILYTCLLTTILLTACADYTELEFGEPEVISSGFQFTEGPYWHPDGFLLFSDIPANSIYRWTPGSDQSEVYIEPSGNSNGITAMPDGSLVLAQHAGRISTVTENLELVPIAEEYNGSRLNSPNDLAVRSDGLIYFTDPSFGVSPEDQELEFNGVYRLEFDGSLSLIYDELAMPNGIAFSPDESQLYANDSQTGQIIRFDVLENGDVENPVEFANVGASGGTGAADGMKTDSAGRVYTTGPGGLFIFNENGEQSYHIEFENRITNMAWGGENKNELYITSPSDIYRLSVNR
ncbi:MAG: SMP-30/gluconolactonase/LRE family protein [Balneolales bacterium]